MEIKVFNGHYHARIDVDQFGHTESPVEFQESVPVYAYDSGGVYMMNFKNPLDISDPLNAAMFCGRYAHSISGIAEDYNPNHRVLIMPVLNNTMTYEQLCDFIPACKHNNVPLAGFKLFTQGQSTNSGYAPSVEQAKHLIDAVQEFGLPLALHMEDPDESNPSAKEVSAMQRVLPEFIFKNGKRRDMNISVEHISTKYGLEMVRRNGLWCTITPHHLAFAQEDFGITIPSCAEKVLSEQYPYFFCKPLIQTEANVHALREVWIHRYSDKIMLGTDSAPHIKSKKTNPDVKARAAGIFMGNTANSYLYAMEKEYGFRDTLIAVEEYSRNAAKFYGVDLNDLKEIKLREYVRLNQVQNVCDLRQAVR